MNVVDRGLGGCSAHRVKGRDSSIHPFTKDQYQLGGEVKGGGEETGAVFTNRRGQTGRRF